MAKNSYPRPRWSRYAAGAVAALALPATFSACTGDGLSRNDEPVVTSPAPATRSDKIRNTTLFIAGLATDNFRNHRDEWHITPYPDDQKPNRFEYSRTDVVDNTVVVTSFGVPRENLIERQAGVAEPVPTDVDRLMVLSVTATDKGHTYNYQTNPSDDGWEGALQVQCAGEEKMQTMNLVTTKNGIPEVTDQEFTRRDQQVRDLAWQIIAGDVQDAIGAC